MHKTLNPIKYPLPNLPLENMQCWCGEAEARTIKSKDRWHQPLTTVQCVRCGTVRLNPRMNESHTLKFYETEYDDTHDPLEFFEVQKSQKAAMIHANFFKGVSTILD